MKTNKIINYLKSIIKVTIKDIIVAFIYAIVIIISLSNIFKNEFQQLNNIIDLISTKTVNNINKDIKLDLTTKKLTSYPEYGYQYAKILIPSININLPVYYGTELDLLVDGVGHTAGYYFPGEGGTILYAGHSNNHIFRDLPNLKNDDIITIETSYGKYNYKVIESKILTTDNFFKEIRPSKDKEILILYTCYPVTAITLTNERYVVYEPRR